MKIRLSNTYLLAIIACFLWSTAFVGIKFGLKYSTPLHFAGIRFILAGLIIIPFTGKITFYLYQIKKNFKLILKISLFQTILLYSLFYLGISFTSASVTALIVGAGPLFVAIMAHFSVKNDKLTLKKIISILIGFSGIVLIASKHFDYQFKEMKEFWGVIILICSNIAGSYGNILVHKDKSQISPLILNSSQQLAGGIFIFILSLFIEGYQFEIKPIEYYFALIYLSLLSAIAFSIWFILLKRPYVKVSEINIWKFLVPLFGALLSWIILTDDHADVISIIGMITIAFSLVLLNYENASFRFKT